MITVFYDAYTVLNKVYGGGAYIGQAFSSTPIEPLNSRRIYKICYGVLDRDIELSYYITVLSPKTPKLPIRTILKIAMYSIKYLSAKPYAVTTTAVELAKKLGKGGTSGYINAFLRNFIGKEFELPADEYEKSAIQYSYPKFALELLADRYGKDTAIKIAASCDERAFIRFRRETDGAKYLEERNISYERTPFENTFAVKGLNASDEGFKSGIYTFQSIGSVAISEISKCGGRVLDACAAPGGKSVYLADFAQSVTCFELHPHRTELIKAYASRMGKSNIEAVCRDSAVYDGAYDGAFDLVLCDVPCSGFGTLKRNPDIKLKKDAQSVFALAETQKKILSVCSKYVKAGGYLVYSTCSIFKEENDDIVGDFLANDGKFETVKIFSPLESLGTPFGLQFLPHLSFGAGFYVAKLKRNL